MPHQPLVTFRYQAPCYTKCPRGMASRLHPTRKVKRGSFREERGGAALLPLWLASSPFPYLNLYSIPLPSLSLSSPFSHTLPSNSSPPLVSAASLLISVFRSGRHYIASINPRPKIVLSDQKMHLCRRMLRVSCLALEFVQGMRVPREIMPLESHRTLSWMPHHSWDVFPELLKICPLTLSRFCAWGNESWYPVYLY